MPIFLLIAGLVLIVAGVRGKEKDLLATITDDGKHFLPFFFVIIAISIIGISQKWRPISNALLILMVVAFVLRSYQSIVQGVNQIITESKS